MVLGYDMRDQFRNPMDHQQCMGTRQKLEALGEAFHT